MIRRLALGLTLSMLWSGAVFAQHRYRPIGGGTARSAPAKTETHAPAASLAAHPTAGPAAVPVVAPPTPAAVAAKPSEQEETLDEIVERVKRRLAQQKVRRPPAVASPRPADAPTAHLRLVWRTSVMWPEDLTAVAPAPPAATDLAPDAPHVPSQERITLSWDGLER